MGVPSGTQWDKNPLKEFIRENIIKDNHTVIPTNKIKLTCEHKAKLKQSTEEKFTMNKNENKVARMLTKNLVKEFIFKEKKKFIRFNATSILTIENRSIFIILEKRFNLKVIIKMKEKE